MTETEIRKKIAQEIWSIDLSEGKEIGSDWYAASLRTRMICAVVAEQGLEEKQA